MREDTSHPEEDIMLDIRIFTREHIPEAAQLFVHTYNRQRTQTPLLPERPHLYDEVSSVLFRVIEKPGAAAFREGTLVGYMVETGVSTLFMGKKTAFSLDLYSQCTVEFQKENIYQKLYEKLSHMWVENGYFTHIFSFWAQDPALSFIFFRLGFGMTHFELLRDLSLPESRKISPSISLGTVDSRDILVSLLEEEPAYYRAAPLFWLLERDESDEKRVEGDILAAFEGNEPIGYMHVKENEAETWLMTDEKTGRIAGAYIKEKYRQKGIGTALLCEAVAWAREKGLERIYVEGESANIQGGNFWMKHFTPVVYTGRRCIDERVRP